MVKVILRKTSHRRRTCTVQSCSPGGPVCTPRNTCFLGLTRVHDPNSISIGSATFAQLTAYGRRPCSGMSFPLKIAHWHEAIWTPSNTWFLNWAHLISHPKRHLDRFSCFCRTAEHGRFNRIRHVAPMCSLM